MHDAHHRAERLCCRSARPYASLLEAKDFTPWLNDGGAGLLKPAANDVLQRWPVARRVNSSRAPADDPSLVERVEVK